MVVFGALLVNKSKFRDAFKKHYWAVVAGQKDKATLLMGVLLFNSFKMMESIAS